MSTTADSVQSDREFVMLLTSGTQLRQRIGALALGHYFEAVKRELLAFFEETPQPEGFDVQVSVVLLAGRQPLIDLQAMPPLSVPTESLLQSRLSAVETPAVWNGPAAFSFRQMIGGGCAAVPPKLPVPFTRLCQPLPDGEAVDDFLERCMRARDLPSTPAQQPLTDAFRKLLTRIQKWLPEKLSKRLIPTPPPEIIPTEPADVLPDLPQEPEEDLVVPDLTPIPLDQIEQLIAAFPNEVRHYWRRIQVDIGRADHAQVAQDCREALRLEPDHPWTMLTLVCALRTLDDSAGALAVLTRLIQSHPRFVDGYVQRAEIYAEIGAYEPMFADLAQALTIAPRSTMLLMRHARVCSALGKLDEAYRDLAILQRLDPHDAQIFALRAYIRRRSSGDAKVEEENRRLALEDIERALKLDPNCAPALGIRAEIRIAQEQLTEAVDDCNRALESDPQYSDALAFRGLALFRQQQILAATADLTKALERGCLLHFVRPLLAEAQHLQGDHEGAIATVDTVLERSPDDPQALMHKSALLMAAESPHEALELLNQLLDKHPDLAVAHAERGNVRRVLQEMDDALEDFDAALRLGTTDPIVRLNRALTLLDLKRVEEALNEFKAGLKDCPDSALGHFHCGRTYHALERHEEALAEYSTSIRLDPEFADVYFQRAIVLMNCDRFQEAIRDFSELIDRSSQPVAYVYRGQARIHAGELELADEDFKEAIELAPGEAEGFRMLQLLTESQYHHRLEAYDDAIERAEEALKADEECLPALLQRAASRWYGNQFVEAVEDYTRALEISGPDASHLNARGQIYAELGEYDLALADLDQALTLLEEKQGELQAYVRNGRGLTLIGLERFDEADASLEQSLLSCPGNAWVHYNRGLLYLAKKETQSALLCFRLALRLTDPALRGCQRARAQGLLTRHVVPKAE